MASLLKIAALFFVLVSSNTETSSVERMERSSNSPITVQRLAKKWNLEKYKYLIFSEAPAEKERNDYLHLKANMTFSSISEGEMETGKWKLDTLRKRIFLAKAGESEEMVLIIDHLSSHQLVLIIDDPSDEEAKNLKIFFKN